MYSHVYRMTVIKLSKATASSNTQVGIYAANDRDTAREVGWDCMSINFDALVKDLRDPEQYQVIWETLKEPA